jgi:hypothetical protein
MAELHPPRKRRLGLRGRGEVRRQWPGCREGAEVLECKTLFLAKVFTRAWVFVPGQRTDLW